MLDKLWVFLFLIIPAIIIIAMAKNLLASKTKAVEDAQMLLPHDFFITLILTFSLWSLLFLLIATTLLLESYKEMIVIISSSLCPFFFWWRKKTIWEQKLKLIIPAPFVPVNIFQIYGICCCVTMKNNINDHNFTKRFFCYCAPNIYEANMIVMWGYFSPKLARLLLHYCAFLPAKRFIVHMNNCGDLPHNFQDLNIDINATLECGTQDKATIRHLIKEARQCLQA